MSNDYDNHERIWLEPVEPVDLIEGRQWCQHNQWGGDGIEYVRADLVPSPASLTEADCEAIVADLDIDWVAGLFGTGYGSGVEFVAEVARRIGSRSPPPTDNVLAEAAKRYLAAIDSEPVKDIWDTWDGKPAEGASKSASDWSWAEHGQKIEACLADLRAALTTEGKP